MVSMGIVDPADKEFPKKWEIIRKVWAETGPALIDGLTKKTTLILLSRNDIDWLVEEGMITMEGEGHTLVYMPSKTDEKIRKDGSITVLILDPEDLKALPRDGTLERGDYLFVFDQ
jgi:hypothetical protein